jgi:hypothetical protein
MTIEEIVNYITTGSKSLVCIFREQVEGLSLLVMSFYIMGKPGAYILSVEFDPIDMVDDGEGWVWHSQPMDMTTLINTIEQHLKRPIDDWENITKSGRLSFYDDDVDNDLYQQQEYTFKREMKLGETILPKGLVWVKRPD